MDRKYKSLIILMFLILFSYIIENNQTINYYNNSSGSSNGSFYSDLNMNENNITEFMELRNNGTTYTPYINFGSSKIELGTKFLGSPLKMWDLQITGLNSYYNLNMNNKSLLNCLNCANKTELNGKVNKSGDNISYLDFNDSTATNIIQALGTTSRIMDFGTGAITFRSGLSLFSRTYTTSTNLTLTQAGSRFLLNMTNALCLNGCGVSALAQLTDSRGIVTVGKFAFSKINDSLNITKVQFFVRANTTDSAANTLAFEATPNNFTVPIHNGTGIRYLCVYADGSYFPSTVACELI